MLHHSGAGAVFVEDAEQLAKVRAVEADLPALEFVIVIEPADADGGTISLDALRERERSQTELDERVDGVGPDAECLFLYTSGRPGRRRRASSRTATTARSPLQWRRGT